MSAVTKAGEVNSAKGAKSFYRDGGAKVLAKAVAKALVSPTLTSADITTSKNVVMAKVVETLPERLRLYRLTGISYFARIRQTERKTLSISDFGKLRKC